MKLFHLADLHLGKQVHHFSMLPDQEFILKTIITAVDHVKPDGVMICGDVYDRSVPSEEAVRLFNYFLEELSRRNKYVFIIAGNHDSAARLSFGSHLMESSNVYIADVFHGAPEPIRVRDNFGELNFYLLPFLKPAMVRAVYPDAKIESYQDAVKYVIDKMHVDQKERNVLLAHQFVTGATTSDSEDKVTVGGIDNVDAANFAPFDYTALGHLHRPQDIRVDQIRYCGTPLKYSFSETEDKKITIVELQRKGTVKVNYYPLTPSRDMRTIRGTYDHLTAKSTYDGTNTQDYLRIVLTDETEIPDVAGKLRAIYPNFISIEYDNARTRENKEISPAEALENRSPVELFAEFYELRNNREQSPEQKAFTDEIIKKVWEDEA